MYKKQASGVVLVLNKFYYNASLPNGHHLYFTGVEEDGTLTNLTDDVNEIRQNCGYLTGTAFFIDNKGNLLTNRHVAQPSIDPELIKQCFQNIAEYAKMIYDGQIREVVDQYRALDLQRRNLTQPTFWGVEAGSEEEIRTIDNEMEQLIARHNELQRERSIIDSQFNSSNITIHPICQLGIGYNDSYVTTEADFMGTITLAALCVARKMRIQTWHLFNFAVDALLTIVMPSRLMKRNRLIAFCQASLQSATIRTRTS